MGDQLSGRAPALQAGCPWFEPWIAHLNYSLFMQNGPGLKISATAVAELNRQAAFTGTPGVMHIDLLDDKCGEGWKFIRIRPGKNDGVSLARADGITLYARQDQILFFQGLKLNYFGDLSGGGFLISTPKGAEASPCGSGFRKISKVQ